jgi:hypothetical protein
MRIYKILYKRGNLRMMQMRAILRTLYARVKSVSKVLQCRRDSGTYQSDSGRQLRVFIAKLEMEMNFLEIRL